VTFVANYGPNCTTGTDTPHPPTALLLDNAPDSITNVTINTPSTSSATVVGYAPDGTGLQFVQGLALGLVCFTPLRTGEFAWPYGGGGVGTGSSVGSSAGSSAASSSVAVSASGSPTGSVQPSATGTAQSGAGRRAAGVRSLVVLMVTGGVVSAFY
jgi:hypothetical protein